LLTLSLLAGEAECGREGLEGQQALFSNGQNIAVSVLFYPQIQNTAPEGLLQKKITPSLPDPIHAVLN